MFKQPRDSKFFLMRTCERKAQASIYNIHDQSKIISY